MYKCLHKFFSLNCSRYQFRWDFWLNSGNWSSYR